jgi:5-methylthioadenosine/S-adenosylhomocysteine deaminase
MHDYVIHNGIVVTVDSDFSVFEDGLICVDESKISYVGPKKNVVPDARKSIDLQGSVVMPGLVNTHSHMPMTLFRGLADDLPLMTWLNEHIFPAEGTHINPDTARKGSLLACIEMISSGTTTVCDGYFHEDEVGSAVFESGLKAVIGQGVIDFPAPGVPDPSKNVEVASQFADKWRDVSSRIKPSVFCHSPYTCGGETIKKAKELAREKDLLFQIHVSETKFEFDNMVKEKGVSPVAYLDSLGVLDGRTLLHHVVWTHENDIEILKRSGAKVSHNPSSNMKLASGVAPVSDFLKAGINTGIGTDGAASNNSLDLFLEMNIAAKLHKVCGLDPTLLSAKELVIMATIDGAKLLGLDGETGSLEVGKCADLIVIDMNKPHLTPCYNPVSHLVYAVKGSDVSSVMVDGKLIMENYELKGVDKEKIISDVTKLAKIINNGK